jgi:hypothetical protein
MLIENATLTRIDTPQAAGPDGQIAYTTGSTIGVRCCVDEPGSAQRYVLGVLIKPETMVLYVDKSATVTAITPGMRLTYTVDGGSSVTRRVVHVRQRVGLAMDHFEAFVQSE